MKFVCINITSFLFNMAVASAIISIFDDKAQSLYVTATTFTNGVILAYVTSKL